ncbi:putative serine protease K12H4.7 [Condylostylus longicornis]|uniref:putative serine protease K12H4.7 n=1 Tax=Condylostylus longicornis TaxID=2530218 RepID=UPI00244DFD7B|nr:putative serine protease K12H4.7 [Condylostylus longicornis]
MNILLIFGIICSILVEFINAGSVFGKTFKILHNEPPPPKSLGRHLILNSVIEQKVDNFDPNNNATWLMRYKGNPEHHKSGGPIFIFLGGEWSISDGFITAGHFYDMAAENNAYLFYTEHRYYGKSFPTSDLRTENLKYLTVGQALADLAYFIKVQKQKPQFKESKIVIAGGSYSATMVTWFRQKYPELSVGGWSSSAPLFAKVDFIEYHEVTGKAIKLVGGENCYNRIEKGVKEFEIMMDTKRYEELKTLFNICDNFNSNDKYDVMSLFTSISQIGAALVQGHNKGSIERDCGVILSGETDVEGIAKWINSYLGGGCNDFTYKTSVKDLSYTELSSNIYRQWIYQTCNEFGWYQTSGSTNQPFGKTFPVDLSEKWCEDVYGITKDQLHKNIANTNEMYGGWQPNVTNVFFTHGQLDPWHPMGVHVNEDGENNIIPLYAHCKDFGSIQDSDTEEMKNSKEKLSKLVKKWLSDK